MDRARFAFNAKRRGYDLGLTDLTTLLTSETTWRQARLTLSTAQVDALVDSATLFQALGGGWTPPPPPRPRAYAQNSPNPNTSSSITSSRTGPHAP